MKKSIMKTATSLFLIAAMTVPLVQPVYAFTDRDGVEWPISEALANARGSTSSSDSSSKSKTKADSDSDSDSSSKTKSGSSSKQGFESSSKYKFSSIKKKVAQHQETNKDVLGWLTVPGTNINEPVLFSNKNNEYYLYRDWKGNNYPSINYANFTSYPASAAYVDYRTKLGETWKKSSKNTVIYGHNWTNLRNPLDIGTGNNHTMFGQLPSYTDINFAKENPYIYYSTGENEGIWKVFAVAYCELKTSFNYNAPNPSNANYEALLKEWKSRSMFDFDVDVDKNDRILTLSTCTRVYNMGENQRYVVVARLLRDGESENDAVKVSVNSNMKQPQF